MLMEQNNFHVGKDQLDTKTLVSLANKPAGKLKLDQATIKKINQSRKVVEDIVATNKTVYGINTGFGFLSDVKIPVEQTQDLQHKIILSHACGVGPVLDPKIAMGIMIAKVHSLALAFSGIRLDCLKALMALVDHDLAPKIPSKGSVGASGDLAPLSHMSLPLLEKGHVWSEGKWQPSKDVLKKHGLTGVDLSAKEGLALINGTQFMSVVGSFAVESARNLLNAADLIASISLNASRGTLAAFDERIHQLRKQPSQALVAKRIRDVFASGDDQVNSSHIGCEKVQDPYSFRCIPQVHGAARDCFNFVENVMNQELNSVTDNPVVFDNGDVLSGGNFHGQPVAQALDFLAISMTDLSSISERRTEKLTNPNFSGLPAFLIEKSGLNSGFMIPHVVAAALVSENKVLAHPACVDSVPTSAEKEDHVSMGPHAAMKLVEICKNVSHVLAIELLSAAQGIHLLRPLKPNLMQQKILADLSKISKPLDEDRSLSEEIEQVAEWIMNGGLEG